MARRATRDGSSFDKYKESLFLAKQRAHGNSSEYIPILVILFLYINSKGSNKFLDITMIIATLSRFSIAYGIGAYPYPTVNSYRYYGAIGTYFTLLILGISALFV